MSSGLSRRELLFSPMRGLRRGIEAGRQPAVKPKVDDTPQVAIIMGRHCLAYQHVTCSLCYERCPEPGAIVREHGIPSVIASQCTGCRICQDVCPAPTNAIMTIAVPPPATNAAGVEP
jgi:Pyruvate/2-oxoacid:ferredoxin oxidoreductase delta subunit